MALTLHVEIDAETGQLSAATTRAGRDIQKFGRDSEQSARRASRAFDDMRTRIGQIGRPIASVTRGLFNLRNALIVTAGAGVLAGYSRLADTWQLMQSRLALVTEGQEELRRTTEDLFAISQRTSTEFTQTVDLYTRLARAQDTLGATAAELLAVTEAVTQSITVSGGSAQSAAGALFQLGQAFDAGIIRAEEFNSIVEGMPRLAQAAADGLGRTRGELRELLVQGELSSQAFFRAILGQAPQVGREFDTMARTSGRALTELRNEFSKAIGVSAQQSDATREIVGALDELREVIADPRFQDNLSFIVTSIIDAGTAAAETVRDFDELLDRFREINRGLVPAPVLSPEGFITMEGLRPPAASISFERPRPSPHPDIAEVRQAAQAMIPSLASDMAAVIEPPGRSLGRMLSPPAQRLELEGRAAELAAIHQGALNDQRERAAALLVSLRTPQEAFNAAIAEYDELLAKGLIGTEGYGRAFAAARAELASTRDELDETAESAHRVDDAANRFGFTFASAFEDAVIGGNSLRDVFQGLLDDINRMVLRLLVIEPIANGIRDSLKDIFDPGSSGGLFGGLLGGFFGGGAAFGGAPGSGFGATTGLRIPGGLVSGGPRQFGGPVEVGKFYETHGLNKREFFVPALPGHIATSGQLAGQGGGSQVNLTIIAPPGTKPRVEEARGAGGAIDLKVILDEGVAANIHQPGTRTRAALEHQFGLQHRLVSRA